MVPTKIAIFRFEASPTIGAGHAIRSSVLADALIENSWNIFIVTSQETYDFIPSLSRFKRLDPEKFYNTPFPHDLLVVDHYGLGAEYESHFRNYTKRILVIDDLANRNHDCDILVDQTYGRDPEDYKSLVPDNCKILAGSDYVLIRKEFVELRPKALAKRRETKEIKRILISMGGSDPKNFTAKALQLVSESAFLGAIDIVLGFAAPHKKAIEDIASRIPNAVTIHTQANMPELIYEADLAIGAAGSSVWERCCLGLLQIAIQTADNQSNIIKLFSTNLSDLLNHTASLEEQKRVSNLIDGLGTLRIICYVNELFDRCRAYIAHKKITLEDLDMIFHWQQDPAIRQHSFNKLSPSYEEHTRWFLNQCNSNTVIFEKILCNEVPCGTIRLDYNAFQDSYLLSWFVTPAFQGRNIGTIALYIAKNIVLSHKIKAFVFESNTPSQRALEKAGFILISKEENGYWYEC